MMVDSNATTGPFLFKASLISGVMINFSEAERAWNARMPKRQSDTDLVRNMNRKKKNGLFFTFF